MPETPEEKDELRKELIDARNSELSSIPPLDPGDKQQRDTAIVALRVAGLSLSDIAHELGISPGTAGAVLKHDENRAVMRLVRDAAKVEAVVQGFRIQRRYLDKLETLPIDRAHAGVHSQIANAYGKIFDKAALAAGEATERTESKTIALNIDMKKEMFEALRDAQEMRFAREAIAAERTAEHAIEHAQPSETRGD